MRRRTLFRGAAAAGISAAGGALAMGAPAQAAGYLIATTEQASRRILVFDSSVTSWNDSAIKWQWTSSGDASWDNLSDVKRRSTANWGTTTLVTASGTAANGGRAAMIQESNKSIAWQCNVPGNPHAIERISNHGAIVVASSRARAFSSSFTDGGGLSMFVPSSHGGLPPQSYSSRIDIGFGGAHGVLWHTTSNHLLAIGTGSLRSYRLNTNGSDIITSVSEVSRISFGTATGHDLQPDFNSGKIFYTVGGTGSYAGVWEVSVNSNGTFTTPNNFHSDWTFTKSYSRLPGGTSFWVDAPNADTWWNDRVGFTDHTSTRSGARFYKARYWNTSFL